jgi:hypothetical protein
MSRLVFNLFSRTLSYHIRILLHSFKMNKEFSFSWCSNRFENISYVWIKQQKVRSCPLLIISHFLKKKNQIISLILQIYLKNNEHYFFSLFVLGWARACASDNTASSALGVDHFDVRLEHADKYSLYTLLCCAWNPVLDR